jgi:hypothetical protein
MTARAISFVADQLYCLSVSSVELHHLVSRGGAAPSAVAAFFNDGGNA